MEDRLECRFQNRRPLKVSTRRYRALSEGQEVRLGTTLDGREGRSATLVSSWGSGRSQDISMFKSQCSKSPKLRTYNSLFSIFVDQNFTDSYTRLCLPFIVRKRLSQLRLGVLPLRIETDRYSRVKIDAKNRFCRQPKCKNNCTTTPPSKFDVENEYHFLMCCKQYDHLRSVLFSKLSCPQFDQMNDQNKFCYMLTCPSVARCVGQFIVDAFDARPVP